MSGSSPGRCIEMHVRCNKEAITAKRSPHKTRRPNRPKDRSKWQLMHWRKYCDGLWKQIIKARAGNACELCGATDKQLQAHHLIEKAVLLYRYDLMNGVCLCASHHKVDKHKSAHKNPIWFENEIWRKHTDRWIWWVEHYLTDHETDMAKPTLQDYPAIAARLELALEKYNA